MWQAAALLALFLYQGKPDYSADGMKALEARQYDAAVANFTKAAAADPTDYSAHFHLGLAYSLLERDAESVAEYKKALELKPGLYEAQLNLGIVLVRSSKHSDAVPYLRAAAEAKPKEFRPLYYYGDALLGSGDGAGAEKQFLAALAIDPKSAFAESALGRALVRQNRIEEADSHFHKAAELDPAFREALLELAQVYETVKQPGKAIELYKQFPNNAAARERLGELLLESGQAGAAIPQLEAAVKESPTSANQYALAMAYLSGKDFSKAEPLLQQAAAAEPDNARLHSSYARVLREQKKYKPAAQEFFRATQLKPDDAEAWSDLAGMLILMENYPQALGALDKVRALGAEKPAHHFFRALVLDKAGVADQALASYQQFLSVSEGKFPDEEFKARQRVRVLVKEVKKR